MSDIAMLADAVDLAALERVLVIKLRHHGDVLLISPVFSVLKNHAPHLEIDALVYADTREMLSLHPAITEVHAVERVRARHNLAQEWRLFQTLRARRYDLIIHLTESPRGAVLARLLGARFRVARAYARRGRLWRKSFTHLYQIPTRPRHTVEIHLDALRRIGVYPTASERGLVLLPGTTAESSVARLLAEHGLRPKGFIHIHPSSRWLFKCWDANKNAELINRLLTAGERVVLTAAPAAHEMAFVNKIKEKVQLPIVDLSGALNLKELAALTAKAKCFVGVDSVPMHIAAAMHVPIVALFGPSGDLEWGPWQAKSRVITSNHSCRPCGLDGCGNSKVSECLTSIEVERVWSVVRMFCTGE